jgi:hypothetical protein
VHLKSNPLTLSLFFFRHFLVAFLLSAQQLEAAQLEISRQTSAAAERARHTQSLDAALSGARRDLEECAQKLASNEQVIAFLNREITESRLSASPAAAHYATATAAGMGTVSSALAFRPTVPVSGPTVRFIYLFFCTKYVGLISPHHGMCGEILTYFSFFISRNFSLCIELQRFSSSIGTASRYRFDDAGSSLASPVAHSAQTTTSASPAPALTTSSLSSASFSSSSSSPHPSSASSFSSSLLISRGSSSAAAPTGGLLPADPVVARLMAGASNAAAVAALPAPVSAYFGTGTRRAATNDAAATMMISATEKSLPDLTPRR